MTLVDGRVGIGFASGVRVGYGDPAELRAAENVRLTVFWELGIEQRVVFGRIAVGPSIHGDRRDVAGGIESPVFERTAELIADVALEGLEGSREELGAAGAILIMFRKSRLAGRAHHVHENRLAGRLRAPVGADGDVRIQVEVAVIASRRIDAGELERGERLAVGERYARIDERGLHQAVQGGLLRSRQLRT